MNAQQWSFDDLPPYQRHSDTSRAAALDLLDPEVKLAMVRDYIKGRGDFGCTDEEGYTALRMNPSTYRPRRIDLTNKYQIVRDSGLRRLTTSRRKAVVWVARS